MLVAHAHQLNVRTSQMMPVMGLALAPEVHEARARVAKADLERSFTAGCVAYQVIWHALQIMLCSKIERCALQLD